MLGMIPLGVMQGRLVPPYNNRYQSFPVPYWQDEFPLAAKMGFDAIEFIFDFENFDESPLITPQGHRALQELKGRTGVGVFSICADYFMRYPMFVEDAIASRRSVDMLARLMDNAEKLGITDITVPCVDESALTTDKQKDKLREALLRVLGAREGAGIKINLETSMGPADFAAFLRECDHPRIKVNYDIGNSASLGFHPDEEILAYGREVSVLHIKDRVLGGGSVQLGTGNANFEKVFTALKSVGFNGIIIMQAARLGRYEGELDFVAEQLKFLRTSLGKWFN